MLTPSPYPYSWLWTYAGDKFFEAEGEIKFSPVYAHDLLLLLRCPSLRWIASRPSSHHAPRRRVMMSLGALH